MSMVGVSPVGLSLPVSAWKGLLGLFKACGIEGVVWAVDGSVKAYNRGRTHFLEVDFNEGFKGFIPIDLKRLEVEVKGLRNGDQIYRVENIDNIYPDYVIITPKGEICYTADVITTQYHGSM